MIFIQIFTIISSICSMAGFFLIASKPLSMFLISFAIIGGVIAICIALYENRIKKGLIFKSDKEINSFMHRWISNSGRTIVFTRDMSWAKDSKEIQGLLKTKAQKDELSIIIPDRNELINELEKNGAKIFDYKELDYVPESRFTIIKYGQASSSRVAVGRRNGKNEHVINEFSVDNPFFWVTQDVAKIIMKFNDFKKAQK
jgi:hypothetical protein